MIAENLQGSYYAVGVKYTAYSGVHWEAKQFKAPLFSTQPSPVQTGVSAVMPYWDVNAMLMNSIDNLAWSQWSQAHPTFKVNLLQQPPPPPRTLLFSHLSYFY